MFLNRNKYDFLLRNRHLGSVESTDVARIGKLTVVAIKIIIKVVIFRLQSSFVTSFFFNFMGHPHDWYYSKSQSLFLDLVLQIFVISQKEPSYTRHIFFHWHCWRVKNYTGTVAGMNLLRHFDTKSTDSVGYCIALSCNPDFLPELLWTVRRLVSRSFPLHCSLYSWRLKQGVLLSHSVFPETSSFLIAAKNM